MTIFALPLGMASGALASSGAQGNLVRDLGGQELLLVKGEKGDKRGHYGRSGGPLGDLARMEARNAAIEVIATLSGQPVESVRRSLEDEGMRETLESYDISREDFVGAMQPRVLAMVEEARDSGRITDEQAARLVERVEAGPKKVGKHETRHMRGGPMGGLARVVGQNMFVDTAAALSGKTTAEVRETLEEEGPRETLEVLGIDHQAFRDAMQSRARAVIEEVKNDGLITPEQAEELIERIDQAPQKHRG